VDFLRRQASDLSLDFEVVHPSNPKKPVCILTRLGTEPNLPSIILSSHMDVVPVFEEFWTRKPFAADIEEDGKIYARGSQDMKCVGTQYLAALRFFKRNNVQFKRTIHAVFTPEEEVGSVEGMRDFVHSDAFKSLNAGFSLDEGIASQEEYFKVFFAERSIWHVEFSVPGNPGHGSLLLKNTAGEKLEKLLNRFIEYRDTQVKRLESDPKLTIGDVTTVNVTMIHGGVQSNVIPPEFKMTVDIRLALDIDHSEFENMFKGWCEEAGEGIVYTFEQKQPKVQATKTDESNRYYTAFKSAITEL
jgi:aminoacylase